MTDKQKSILSKIKAIIDDTPYDGERESATAMFNRLCKKYGIEPSDFENAELGTKFIKYPKDCMEKRIVYHAIWKIHEDKFKRQPSLWSRGDKKNHIGIKLTNAELIELSAYVDFYLLAFRREVDLFTTAFIHANSLACSAKFLGRSIESESMFYTDEELKIMKMTLALEKNEYYARLGTKRGK